MDANGELTSAELALLRTHPQRTDLYLAIPTYAIVFTAVAIAPTPATNDGVYQVTFNGGAGATWANVVSGMTLLVGTAAGGSDIGLARIRDIITTADAGVTGTIYIGTTSEIDFSAGQFLTITNEFGLWPRHPYVDPATGEEFMDWDIDYADVTLFSPHVNFAPVPCMLPHAVVELVAGTASVFFTADELWVPGIPPGPCSYEWTCSGATGFAPNAISVGVTISFSSSGTYLVRLKLTAPYGGGNDPISYGYRYVIVYDDTSPIIKSPILESCSGDYDNGGWSYRVTCHSQANLATIHNRTLCILVADDWYGATHQSIGPIVGRENIVCIGWIDGESITWSNDTGNVSFDVQGPHWWLDRMPGYPTGVDDVYSFVHAWTEIEELTAAKGLWHFLYWRTTAASIMDISGVARHGTIPMDTRRLATTYTPAGSLWEQLRAIADRIFARATCNRYGQLFINVDMQLVEVGSFYSIRGTHPNILGADGLSGFNDADWRDEITIERRTVSEAALVDLSGIFWSGVVATNSALFSLAPGHYFKHYGRPATRDRLALSDQTESNLLAGLYLGWLNNEYPTVDVPLAANNRCFDIAPYMFSWMTIAASDTPRGIEWPETQDEPEGKRLIPRRVSFERDASEAVMLANVTFEAQTFATTAMIGDPPIEPPEPDPTNPPPPPCICDDPTATNYGGQCPCLFETSEMIVMHNYAHILRSLNFFTVGEAAIWEEIPIIGQFAADTICSLSIDPDGLGAWLVTIGTTGEIESVSVSTAGIDYTVGDIISLAAPVGGTSATVTVAAINPVTGGVLGVTITTGGTHYEPGYFGTTGGTGSGCIIRVLTISYTDSGVYRTDDISSGSFSMVLSQGAAKIAGLDYKQSLGIARSQDIIGDWGELRSSISFGNGSVCVPEIAYHGINDRAPTCVFTSTNSGGTWTIGVPLYNAGATVTDAFWANQYFDTPCHNVDWDGAQLVITGRMKSFITGVEGAYAESPDGIAWTAHDLDSDNTQLDYFSCNIIGGIIYAYLRTTVPANSCVALLLPINPPPAYTPALVQSFGFRRTQSGGLLNWITHTPGTTVPNSSTDLYSGLTKIVSGGDESMSIGVANGGTGYSIFDFLTLEAPPGGTSATCDVTGIMNPGGIVASVMPLTSGSPGYPIGTYNTTTGGAGIGCTISVTSPGTGAPFGVARVISADDIVVAARDHCHVNIVTYISSGNIYDRTGNLPTILGVGGWEGTEPGEPWPNNAIDASGIEYISI